MKILIDLLLMFALMASVFVCQSQAGQLSTFVSIPPQMEFVRRVGGSDVTVEVLLGQGQNPHSFDPSPRAVARLGEASLFFRAGVPYEEHLVDRLAELFQDLEIVETHKQKELLEIESDDPHTWLDIELVKIQVLNICNALLRADPANAAAYRSNMVSYLVALDSLNTEIRGLLEPFRGRQVYVYHPAFGYFLESYGLKQRAVQVGGHEPSAKELASLVDRMRSENVRTLFVQPEFPSPVADALSQALGCRVVRLDPLAGNYLENMGRMARLVAGALPRQD